MQSWLLWLVAATVLIGFEVLNRYIRFKRTPQAWSIASLATGGVMWSSAWLVISYFFDRQLDADEIVQSVLLGAIYFGSLLLVGRRIKQLP